MDRDSPQIVTVFGGSGFVGTQLVQALARKGWRVRVAVRRPDLAGHLRPLGDVGQVMPIQANVRNADSVRRAVHGASAVVNLVAVGFQRGAQRFAAVNVDGAETVAQAAKAAGATTLTHMSILGADPDSASDFARSRAQGEAAVVAAFPKAVITRPSLIFGKDDSFFNMMGSMARVLPVMPLIGGKTKFQPVYVGDVADALAIAAGGGVKGGRVYELGGPEVVTHKELLEIILRETMRNNLLLPLPEGIARLIALPAQLLPTPLITPDQVRLLQVDNVVSPAAAKDGRTLAAFGISPTPMDAILPTYLWRFRRHGQFDRIAA
jgi:NADH dehydrogenase